MLLDAFACCAPSQGPLAAEFAQSADHHKHLVAGHRHGTPIGRIA
jgi:hypothetical protein